MDSNHHMAPLDEAEADLMFAKRGCCCFWMPWSDSQAKRTAAPPSTAEWWERIRAAERREGWWSRGWRALLKVREWSEIVAGPRWKTFIRRFNRNHPRNLTLGGKFQYDPLSYALNFDEGHGQNADSDGETGVRGFSARFVVTPGSAKSSMDLGGRDSPQLFATTAASAVAAH